MPERVVLDTNIWVSGLMWRGKPYQCLLLARARIVQSVYCQAMAAELSRKLREAFGFSENHIRTISVRSTTARSVIAHLVPGGTSATSSSSAQALACYSWL